MPISRLNDQEVPPATNPVAVAEHRAPNVNKPAVRPTVSHRERADVTYGGPCGLLVHIRSSANF